MRLHKHRALFLVTIFSFIFRQLVKVRKVFRSLFPIISAKRTILNLDAYV